MCWQENSLIRNISKKIKIKSREANPKKQAQNEQIFIKTHPICLSIKLKQQ